MNKFKSKIDSIDLVRGIAALSVCFFHFSEGAPAVKDNPLSAVFRHGYLGVDAFFVISGFVIPWSLHKSQYSVSKFGQYMKKRIIRICPPSYIALLLAIIQHYIAIVVLKSAKGTGLVMDTKNVLCNFTYLVPAAGTSWYNGVFWTLAIEFQFYLLIGVIFDVFKVRKLSWIFVLLLGIVGIGNIPFIASNILFFKYSSLFTLGVLIFLLKIDRLNRYTFWIAIFCTLALCMKMLAMENVIVGTMTVFIILFLNFKSSLTAFFGRISYSLYLTHLFIGTSVEAIVKRLFVFTDFQKIAFLFFLVGISIGFATVFYVVFEKPFIAFSSANEKGTVFRNLRAKRDWYFNLIANATKSIRK